MGNFKWQVGDCGCGCKTFCEKDVLVTSPCVLARGIKKEDVEYVVSEWGKKYPTLIARIRYPSCEQEVLKCITAIKDENSEERISQVMIQSVPVSDSKPVIKTLESGPREVFDKLDDITSLDDDGYAVFLCNNSLSSVKHGVLTFSSANDIEDISDPRVTVSTPTVEKIIANETSFITDNLLEVGYRVYLTIKIEAKAELAFKNKSPSFYGIQSSSGTTTKYFSSGLTYYALTPPNDAFTSIFKPGVIGNGGTLTFTSNTGHLKASGHHKAHFRLLNKAVNQNGLLVGIYYHGFYIPENEAVRFYYIEDEYGYVIKIWIAYLMHDDWGYDINSSLIASDVDELPDYVDGFLVLNQTTNVFYQGSTTNIYYISFGRSPERMKKEDCDVVYSLDDIDDFIDVLKQDMTTIMNERLTEEMLDLSVGLSADYQTPCSEMFLVEKSATSSKSNLLLFCQEK
jgi:hypothetical protein